MAAGSSLRAETIPPHGTAPDFKEVYELLRTNLDGATAENLNRAAVEGRVPAGRFATPDEVAAVAAFLTTPEAGYVNGAVIPVDGGLTAGVGLPRN